MTTTGIATRAGSRWGRVLPFAAMVGVAAALLVLPLLVGPYPTSVAATGLVAATLATSTRLLLLAGLPSLGQAAYLGVGGYTAAALGRHGVTSGPVQLLAATLAAATVAAVVGAGLSRTRGLVFLLASLAVGELAHTLAENATSVTGGGAGQSTPSVILPGLGPLDTEAAGYRYTLAITALLVVVLVWVGRSRFGLVLGAVADHEPRTRANAHPVDAQLWAAYILAGAVAGAGGALLVAAHGYLSPADAGLDASALALLAAVIAGPSIISAGLAALGLVLVRDLAGGLWPGGAPTLLGITFLAAALAPVLWRRSRKDRR